MITAPALEAVFHACFLDEYNTQLQGGAAEPLYTPATVSAPAVIHYREDFPASLLHEVAHWCIAGAERRRQEDYGYWYAPDGRDARQQREFEQVEVRPQALEWHLALACGVAFRISHDNLTLPEDPGCGFHEAVDRQARRFCAEPLPPRGQRFRSALAAQFGGVLVPEPAYFPGPGAQQ